MVLLDVDCSVDDADDMSYSGYLDDVDDDIDASMPLSLQLRQALNCTLSSRKLTFISVTDMYITETRTYHVKLYGTLNRLSFGYGTTEMTY